MTERPKLLLTVAEVGHWLQNEASPEEKEAWIKQLTYGSIMATSREFDKQLEKIQQIDPMYLKKLLSEDVGFLGQLVTIASIWSFDRDRTDSTLHEMIRQKFS